MPDAFFQKKRKRTSASGAGARAGPSRSKPSSSASSSRMRKPNADSDADDDDVPGGGIDDMDLTHNYNDAPNSDDEAEAAETPAEARVRLAKMYLQGLSDSPAGDDFFEGAEQPSFGLADAAQADRDNIAARLQKDVAEQSGKIHLFLADRIAASPTADAESGTVLTVKGHRLSVTAAVASADTKWLFTASKDGNIIRWRMSDGKMVRVLPRRARVLGDDGQPVPPTTANRSKTSGAARRRARFTAAAAANGDKGKTSDRADAASYISVGAEQGHTDEIWSLSLSSDGSYLASGGKDSRVCVWDTTPRSEEKFLKALGGHKDAISAVQFRTGSHELYTASLDRTLKLYDVAQLSYIETLFGHQESVLSLSCLGAETAVSAGGRDRTCRFWKIRDESQLVFRAGAKSKLRDVLEGGDLARQALSGEGGKMSAPTEAVEGSVEVVAMIDQSHFVSGGDSGSVSLWNLGRKKPVHSVPVAHGFELTTSESEGEIRTPRWITAVAALPYSDVFASASWDGNVRLWKIIAPGGSIRSFEPLMDVSVQGVVNSIQLVQPPLSSVRVASDGTLGTNAVVASKWKHAKGAAETEGKALTRVTATKQNAPPLLIVAAGKEHRLGRWINLPTATNATTIFPLTLTHAE